MTATTTEAAARMAIATGWPTSRRQAVPATTAPPAAGASSTRVPAKAGPPDELEGAPAAPPLRQHEGREPRADEAGGQGQPRGHRRHPPLFSLRARGAGELGGSLRAIARLL